jgi:hypothetical protein
MANDPSVWSKVCSFSVPPPPPLTHTQMHARTRTHFSGWHYYAIGCFLVIIEKLVLGILHLLLSLSMIPCLYSGRVMLGVLIFLLLQTSLLNDMASCNCCFVNHSIHYYKFSIKCEFVHSMIRNTFLYSKYHVI